MEKERALLRRWPGNGQGFGHRMRRRRRRGFYMRLTHKGDTLSGV